MFVMGFEGCWRKDTTITWGSAAVRDGNDIINAGSGFRSKLDDTWPKAVADQVVTMFSIPVDVGDKLKIPGAIVLGLRVEDEGSTFSPPRYSAAGAELFRPTMALAKTFDNGRQFFIYSDSESFRQDFEAFQKAILEHFMGVLSTGLTMHAHALELNVVRTALRCLDDEDTTFTKRLGRAILRDDRDTARFEKIFGLPPGD